MKKYEYLEKYCKEKGLKVIQPVKIREDYENVGWRRFVRWVNGDEQPQRKEKETRRS